MELLSACSPGQVWKSRAIKAGGLGLRYKYSCQYFETGFVSLCVIPGLGVFSTVPCALCKSFCQLPSTSENRRKSLKMKNAMLSSHWCLWHCGKGYRDKTDPTESHLVQGAQKCVPGLLGRTSSLPLGGVPTSTLSPRGTGDSLSIYCRAEQLELGLGGAGLRANTGRKGESS